MTINDAKWEYTVKSHSELKEYINKLNNVLTPLDLQPESVLYETPYKLVNLVIEILEKLIDDDFGNLNCFIWEMILVEMNCQSG